MQRDLLTVTALGQHQHILGASCGCSEGAFSKIYVYIYIVYKLYMHILQWRSFSPCHRSKIDERQCTNRFFGLLCSSVPTIEVKPPELPALVFATSHLESLDEHQAGQTCNSTCDLQRHRG